MNVCAAALPDELPRFRRALALHNEVPQGLSSSIFYEYLARRRNFSREGSDCGIANVNTERVARRSGGPLGEKKKRAAVAKAGAIRGKMYMRRQTNTINFSTELPLAQGIHFGGDDA